MASDTPLHGRLGKIFLRGASLLVPVAVALWVVVWLMRSAESMTSTLLTLVLPPGLYVPDMGVVLVLTVVFLAGLLMYPWITRKLVSVLDGFLRRIPLFGTVYSPVKDLMDMFSKNMEQQLGKPVMITIPNTTMETLGFIIRRSADGLPEGFLPEDHIVVFVQWSSQVGGYCFIVPRDCVRELDMSVEDGLRWSLTAGLSGPRVMKDA